MIQTWNYFISGFTENRSQLTGLGQAWHKCQEAELKSTTCSLFPWNYNWFHEARRLQNFATPSPTINIFGYSWGAGYGAIQLAENLRTVGNYDVHVMVLADPVYCDPCFLLRWKTIFSSRYAITRRFAPVITIPSNVRAVYWSRQYKNWPRAHSLQAEDKIHTAIMSPKLETRLEHGQMDEAPWFQEKVKETWEK